MSSPTLNSPQSAALAAAAAASHAAAVMATAPPIAMTTTALHGDDGDCVAAPWYTAVRGASSLDVHSTMRRSMASSSNRTSTVTSSMSASAAAAKTAHLNTSSLPSPVVCGVDWAAAAAAAAADMTAVAHHLQTPPSATVNYSNIYGLDPRAFDVKVRIVDSIVLSSSTSCPQIDCTTVGRRSNFDKFESRARAQKRRLRSCGQQPSGRPADRLLACRCYGCHIDARRRAVGRPVAGRR